MRAHTRKHKAGGRGRLDSRKPFLVGLTRNGGVKQRQLELSEEAVGRIEAELAPLRDADIFLGNKISSFQHQT